MPVIVNCLRTQEYKALGNIEFVRTALGIVKRIFSLERVGVSRIFFIVTQTFHSNRLKHSLTSSQDVHSKVARMFHRSERHKISPLVTHAFSDISRGEFKESIYDISVELDGKDELPRIYTMQSEKQFRTKDFSARDAARSHEDLTGGATDRAFLGSLAGRAERAAMVAVGLAGHEGEGT